MPHNAVIEFSSQSQYDITIKENKFSYGLSFPEDIKFDSLIEEINRHQTFSAIDEDLTKDDKIFLSLEPYLTQLVVIEKCDLSEKVISFYQDLAAKTNLLFLATKNSVFMACRKVDEVEMVNTITQSLNKPAVKLWMKYDYLNKTQRLKIAWFIEKIKPHYGAFVIL